MECSGNEIKDIKISVWLLLKRHKAIYSNIIIIVLFKKNFKFLSHFIISSLAQPLYIIFLLFLKEGNTREKFVNKAIVTREKTLVKVSWICAFSFLFYLISYSLDFICQRLLLWWIIQNNLLIPIHLRTMPFERVSGCILKL